MISLLESPWTQTECELESRLHYAVQELIDVAQGLALELSRRWCYTVYYGMEAWTNRDESVKQIIHLEIECFKDAKK